MEFLRDVVLHEHQESITLAHDASPCKRWVVNFELAELKPRFDALPMRCHLIGKCAEYQIIDVKHDESLQLSSGLSLHAKTRIQKRLRKLNLDQVRNECGPKLGRCVVKLIHRDVQLDEVALAQAQSVAWL